MCCGAGGAGGGDALGKEKGSKARVCTQNRGGAAVLGTGCAQPSRRIEGCSAVHPPAQGAVPHEQTRAPPSLAERQVKCTRRVGKAELAREVRNEVYSRLP